MANASLKAVILAAGKGTRMKSLTRDVPKPMLQVAGKPVLEHIVTNLVSAGACDICIITGYKAEIIESYFGNGSLWGARLQYIRQAVQDGTGKAPELAKDFIGSNDFFLTYGDILVAPSNYSRMAEAFRRTRPTGLLTVMQGQDVTQLASISFDADFHLREIVEKPSPGTFPSKWHNAGLYLFTPVLFAYTIQLSKSVRGEYELPDALRAMVADGHPIEVLPLEGYWIDVRDSKMLAEAQRLVNH